jgi:hypothetical protein
VPDSPITLIDPEVGPVQGAGLNYPGFGQTPVGRHQVILDKSFLVRDLDIFPCVGTGFCIDL